MSLQSTTKQQQPVLDLGGLGVGLMQWGTTNVDDKFVNPKGNLSDEEVQELWKICRQRKIVFYDTAEGVSILAIRKRNVWPCL